MRKLRIALLAGGLGFVVSFITACGGGAGLLSGSQASNLNNQLSQVSSAYSAGDCNGVRSATRKLVSGVAALPTSVAGMLRQDLDQAANQVSTLAVAQCRPAASTTTSTTQTTNTTNTTTVTTPPTTTTTTTTPTHTTTPPTTPTTPATTTTTPGTNTGPSGGGALSGGSGGTGGAAGGGVQGGGNGNGNGNGNG
jgi:hypothetical protein